MVIIFVLLVVLAALIAAVLISPVHISFLFDTVKEEMAVRAGWLGFVGMTGTVIEGRIHITVCLWHTRVYAGYPKRRRKKGSAQAMLGDLALSGTRVRFTYGSSEPHKTGLFCAAGEIIRALLQTAEVDIDPVFITPEDFLTIEAETWLNLGKTLLNMIETRLHITKKRRRHDYGSAELNG
jgi:hypothetical protein